MDKKGVFRESLYLFLLFASLILCNIIIKSKNSEEKVINKISSSLHYPKTYFAYILAFLLRFLFRSNDKLLVHLNNNRIGSLKNLL